MASSGDGAKQERSEVERERRAKRGWRGTEREEKKRGEEGRRRDLITARHSAEKCKHVGVTEASELCHLAEILKSQRPIMFTMQGPHKELF
jgi:hypothetical protein